jgi:hypothetical protein
VLRERLAEPWRDGWRSLWYRELAEHDPAPHFGHHARAYGLEIAAGEYITYCDDDDALRPEHCHMLAAALDANPGAGFAVSRMASHGPHGDTVIGSGPLAAGDLGTPMVLHRRELAETAGGWESGGRFEDWNMILRWLNAGIEHVRVDRVTCDSWPSAWRRETV